MVNTWCPQFTQWFQADRHDIYLVQPPGLSMVTGKCFVHITRLEVIPRLCQEPRLFYMIYSSYSLFRTLRIKVPHIIRYHIHQSISRDSNDARRLIRLHFLYWTLQYCHFLRRGWINHHNQVWYALICDVMLSRSNYCNLNVRMSYEVGQFKVLQDKQFEWGRKGTRNGLHLYDINMKATSSQRWHLLYTQRICFTVWIGAIIYQVGQQYLFILLATSHDSLQIVIIGSDNKPFYIPRTKIMP